MLLLFASALEEGFQALPFMLLLFASDFGTEHSARSSKRFPPVFWMDFDSKSVTPTSCTHEGPSGRDSRGTASAANNPPVSQLLCTDKTNISEIFVTLYTVSLLFTVYGLLAIRGGCFSVVQLHLRTLRLS